MHIPVIKHVCIILAVAKWTSLHQQNAHLELSCLIESSAAPHVVVK